MSPGNAYIRNLVIPISQYVPVAVERAFGRSGRMSNLPPQNELRWQAAYAYKPFTILTTKHEFRYSKRTGSQATERIASNISAAWTPHFREVLIGGVLQGRKQFDPRGACQLSRKSMWQAAAKVAADAGLAACFVAARKYKDVKSCEALASRVQVKNEVREYVLKGWTRNAGDKDFGRT